jgi:hypothetical protein
MKRAPILRLGCFLPPVRCEKIHGKLVPKRALCGLPPPRHIPNVRLIYVSWQSPGCIIPPVATAPAVIHVLEKCPFITTTRLLTTRTRVSSVDTQGDRLLTTWTVLYAYRKGAFSPARRFGCCGCGRRPNGTGKRGHVA